MNSHSLIMFLKHKISDLFSIVTDTLVDDSDGRAVGRRGMLFGNFCAGIVSILVTGTYATGLILAMGADETYISYVTMVTTLSGFAQFFAPLLWERMKKRKRFILSLRVIYHIINVAVLGVIPILPIPKGLMLGSFIVGVILQNLILSFCTPGISIWHMQSLPLKKQSNYFTLFNLGGTLINITVNFCAARFVDTVEKTGTSFLSISPTICAFLMLRVIALIVAVFELYNFSKIPEFQYESDLIQKNNHGLRLLTVPLRNKLFMQTISITLIWNFACAIIGNYYNVYLIDIVDMSYTYISLSGVISTPIIIIMTSFWGMMIKRRKWYRILSLTILGYSLAYFFNVVVTSTTQYFYFVVIIFCYIFNPCINIIFATIPYMNMPETNRTAYISCNALCTTIVTFAGNFVGTVFMKVTAGIEINFFGFRMLNYQYINLFQMALIIALAVYTLKIGKKLTNKI